MPKKVMFPGPDEVAEERLSFSLPEGQDIRVASVKVAGVSLLLNDAEVEVLRKVRDRDRTAAVVHGGLKSLLTLTDDETKTLLEILRRVG